VFQFTLEKKYIAKQKTYLFARDNFNFKYRIDFLNMTQTNLDTINVCRVVRRPLFVSRVDIEQNK
jgi:GTP cyclohydrolase III